MKTTKRTANIPKVKLIATFAASVIVFCLVSILVPRASDLNTLPPNVVKDFSSVIGEEAPESLLELQDWMLDFQEDNAASI